MTAPQSTREKALTINETRSQYGSWIRNKCIYYHNLF